LIYYSVAELIDQCAFQPSTSGLLVSL